MPHEPLDLDEIVDRTLDGEGRLDPQSLRSRTVLALIWEEHTWELWVLTLPSGILLYCDSDGSETRILASARRGNPNEADGFFLERLAQSRGHDFGIEMAGPLPQRIRSSIGDRDFLADVFVDLLEGTDAETTLGEHDTDVSPAVASAEAESLAVPSAEADFRAVVVAWLNDVLTAPPPGRRQPRVSEDDPSA